MVITVNPFSQLAGTVAPILMQVFVIIMIALVIISTLLDIVHRFDTIQLVERKYFVAGQLVYHQNIEG